MSQLTGQDLQPFRLGLHSLDTMWSSEIIEIYVHNYRYRYIFRSYTCRLTIFLSSLCRPVASQPGGGGSELRWVEHQAHPPPLGHCPRDVINLKNAPTLGHSQAPPPLGHCPCDVINLKNAPTLGHSQAPPPPPRWTLPV